MTTPKPLGFSTWLTHPSTIFPSPCCPASYLGGQERHATRTGLEKQSTVTKHTGIFCFTALYTLTLLQRRFDLNFNPFFAKLCSHTLPRSHPLKIRHVFQRLRRAHLAREQIKAARMSSSMLEYHICNPAVFDVKYCGTLHFSTCHHSVHMQYCRKVH